VQILFSQCKQLKLGLAILTQIIIWTYVGRYIEQGTLTLFFLGGGGQRPLAPPLLGPTFFWLFFSCPPPSQWSILSNLAKKVKKNFFAVTVSIFHYEINEPLEDQLPTFTLVGVWFYRKFKFFLTTAKSK
jgi:hypothetical protein